MRTLSDTEAGMQRETIKYLRRNFIFMNTDPMPSFESDGKTKVHAIRYGGINGGPNRYGL